MEGNDDVQIDFSNNVDVDMKTVIQKNVKQVITEFFASIKTGNISRVKEMIDKYPNIITNTKYYQTSTFAHAADNNQFEVFIELVENSDASFVNSNKHIFYQIISHNNVKFLYYFIEIGFQITDESVCQTIRFSNFELTKILLTEFYPQFDFNYSSNNCAPPLICYLTSPKPKLEVVKFLIDNGAKVFSHDEYKASQHTTLSVMAARVVPREIFDFVFDIIIEKFPELINLVNSVEYNSLGYVVSHLHLDNYVNASHIINRLIEHGININIGVPNNSTPLSQLIKSTIKTPEKINLVNIFINHGAQVTFEAMLNAFIYSWYHGDQIIRILLENGGDIDMQNQDGETILMKVIGYFSIEKLDTAIFNFFKDSDLNLKTKNNETAYDVMMKVLKKYSSDETPETVFDGISRIIHYKKKWGKYIVSQNA